MIVAINISSLQNRGLFIVFLGLVTLALVVCGVSLIVALINYAAY